MAATIDKDLTTTLKAARGGKPMRFAFLPKGSEGKLLVGKKIPPPQIAETKKEIGASSVLKGRCVGEDGTLVFYVVKEPPGTLHGQLKKRLKDDAGLTCPLEIRVSADAEDELAEGEAEATGGAGKAPAGGDLTAHWKAKLAEYTPALKAAMAAKGPNAAAIAKLLTQANALSKPGGDMAQALAKLTECQALATGRTVDGEVSAADAAGQAPSGPDLAAQWKKNLAEWTPTIKAALAAKGPNAAAIGKLLAQAVALSKPGGDMAQALAKLTECHDLALSGPANGTGGGAEAAGETAADTAAETEAEGADEADAASAAAEEPAATGPGSKEDEVIQKVNDLKARGSRLDQIIARLDPDLAAAFKGKVWDALRLTIHNVANLAESERMIQELEAELKRVAPHQFAGDAAEESGEVAGETAGESEAAGQAESQTEPQTPTARSEAASPSPPPTRQQAPTDEAALQAEYERRVLALEPKVLEAEKTRKGQAKWLTLFMSAQDRGSDGEFDKAFQILDKLEVLLNAKGPETPTSKGRLVKQRQFMLTRWARIPAELKVALDQYKKLIIKEQADTNPDELIAAIEAYLHDLLAKIQDDLDAAINAGDMSRFVGLRTRVAEDKVLVHLVEAPAMDGAKFQGAILTAMAEIEAALAV